MMNRKTFLKISAALSGALALSAITSAASADQAAEDFIRNILDEAEPALTSGDQSQMFAGIEQLASKYVDMRRVGLFAVGQYARQMSDEQRDEYLGLFEQYATLVYQNSLSQYTGQRLAITGSIDRSERDIIVNSEVENAAPGDAFADLLIHWRVYRDSDGNMSIVDAGANNVWLAIEQRSQFTSVIANNGGGAAGIDALISQLREQVGG